MLNSKRMVTIFVIITLGTAYITLIGHFFFPVADSLPIIIEILMALSWGCGLALMYFLQFLVAKYEATKKISKDFMFFSIVQTVIIWYGISLGLTHSFDTTIIHTKYEFVFYILSLIISIIITLKATHDGKIR